MGSQAYNAARAAGMAVGRERDSAIADGMDRRTNQATGNALQAGDYAGAAAAQFNGGNVAGGIAVQNAGRERQTADQDQQRAAFLAVVTGLKVGATDVPSRRAQLQAIGPRLGMYGVTPEMLQGITDQDLTDQGLDGVISMLGGTARGNAPSGYRYLPDGTLQAIPGGPEDPRNQRPIVTPYGIMMPPGAPLPNMGQGATQGQPQGQQQGDIVRQLPPGVVPFNQAPRAPAARGAERSQTPRVSFQSSGDATNRVRQMVPGVNVTNADRTPDDTARLRRQGYNPSDTSFHLQGQALDLTPPRGMSMAQLEAKMREAGFRVLNEGHHIHVSW